MTDHPDDERLDDAHAVQEKAARKRQRSTALESSLIAAAAVLIAVSTGVSAWNTWELSKISREADRIRTLTLLGTECIVEQLSEHRHLNALGHRANAADHGYSYPIAPENEPPVVPGVLENVCKTFLHTTTTSIGRK